MRRVARPLLYLGTAAIVLGLGRYHAQFIGHYYFHASQRLPWTLGYAGTLCVVAYGMGLPDLERRRSAWGASLGAASLGAVSVSTVQLLLGSLLLPRFVVLASVALVTPWFALCVGIADIGRQRDEERDRVVLVSGPEEHAALAAELSSNLERSAVLDSWLRPEEVAGGHSDKRLVERVLDEHGTLLVLDRSAAIEERVVRQAAVLHEAGLRVRTLSIFYDEWLGKLPVAELERMSLMFDLGELHRVRYARVKRLYDVCAGAVGAVGFIAALPLVLAGNAVANRGPLFYRQQRVGRGGREFEIIKFRTMRPDAGQSVWTEEGDTRVTRWGRVLRRTHIDELPQVLNILRGEQSIVGPRPEQPQYVAELRDKIPFYDLRHLVRPGLTGWAQVNYQYGASETDALEKLQYDFYYLRHQSLV